MSISYLAPPNTQLQSQLQIKIKRNLKSAIFSYLHHRHPTYAQEQLLRERGIKDEEEEGNLFKQRALGINTLRHRSAAQGQDTLEDMDWSNWGKGLCTHTGPNPNKGQVVRPCDVLWLADTQVNKCQ